MHSEKKLDWRSLLFMFSEYGHYLFILISVLFGTKAAIVIFFPPYSKRFQISHFVRINITFLLLLFGTLWNGGCLHTSILLLDFGERSFLVYTLWLNLPSWGCLLNDGRIYLFHFYNRDQMCEKKLISWSDFNILNTILPLSINSRAYLLARKP